MGKFDFLSGFTPGRRGFVATQIPGTAYYARASEGYTDDGGGLISAWADTLSGKGKTATAATTARPTRVAAVLNGQPVMRFDGSANVLTIPGDADLWSQKFTLVAVVKCITQISEMGIAGIDIVRYGLTRFTDNNVYGYLAAGGNNAAGNVALGSFFALKLIWDGTTGANSLRLYKGATLLSQIASAQGIFVASGNFMIGKINNAGFSNIDVAEVGLWTRDWSTAERGTYDAYCTNRYGI